MNTVQVLATLKVVAYCIPLALLLRTARWRWLIGALIVGALSNALIAFGADRLVSSLIGLVFLILLFAHTFDVSRFSKP